MPARAATSLDSNAGALLRPEVVEALRDVLDQLKSGRIGNPSSAHAPGRAARRLLNEARDQIARALSPSQIHHALTLTSSGTEANQLAIRGILERTLIKASGKPLHWVTTPVEHECVHAMIEWARSRGIEVSLLPVDSAGKPDVTELRGLIKPHTALVSAIWVGNETGVVTDVEALARMCRAHGIPLHLDAAQAWGKVEIDLGKLGADLVAFSGHKIGAPAGVGCLAVRKGLVLEPLIAGSQESGSRGGTENLLGIVGLGAAAASVQAQAWDKRVRPLRELLESELAARVPGVIIHGRDALRVANTVSLRLSGIETDGLVAALDLEGYAVSAGSACAAGSTEPSRVLLASGLTEAQAKSAVRVSLSDSTTEEELRGFVDALARVSARFEASA